jgi:phosphoglycerol transferase MdoB-like AlkP superfamily enzyme
MPPLISALTSRGAAIAGARWSFWHIVPLAVLHLAALVLLLLTEYYEFPYIVGFLLAWGILNFVWLAVLRRPGVAAMLSLTMIVILIQLSKYKVSIVAQTVNFMDVMVIDPATVAYLFALFPGFRVYVAIAIGLLALALAQLWRLDVLRLSRMPAMAGAGACLAGLVGLSFSHPFEISWFGDGHLSNFARSGVDAMREFTKNGFMQSDASVTERLKTTPDTTCQPVGSPPHIVLVHDESAFDIRMAPNIKVPPEYGRHFRSFDGKQRNLIVDVVGGGSWYTEYNVLAGLSTRSFGRFDYFVTRIAAGRVERGLPHTLRKCGYKTFSLYPYHGAFLSAKSFHTTTGVQRFYDMNEMRAREFEPDRFYYNAALRVFEHERANGPMFVYVYLSANHSPWTYPWMPELTPGWKDLGNPPEVDEYLRRQTLGMQDYKDFLARLERNFSGASFVLLRYGDHQPKIATSIIEPNLSQAELAQRLMTNDPRYLTTYYAIDTINFTPVNVSSAVETLEVPHIPLVLLEAAGLPLDPSFAEQKRIFERCRGLFYRCADGAEARRFNRLLIDAGLIKGL